MNSEEVLFERLLKDFLESLPCPPEITLSCDYFIKMMCKKYSDDQLAEKTYGYHQRLLTDWSQFCLFMKEHHNSYGRILIPAALNLGLETKNPSDSTGVLAETVEQKYCMFHHKNESLSSS